VTIGTKIFGLAGSILVLMAMPAILEMVQMTRSSQALVGIVENDVPLRASIAKIGSDHLTQSISAERALRFGGATLFARSAEVRFSEARESFNTLSVSLASDFRVIEVELRQRIAASGSSEERDEAQALADKLGQLSQIHSEYEALVRKTFRLVDEGRSIEMGEVEGRLDELQAELQRCSAEFQFAVDIMMGGISQRSVASQRRAITISMVTGILVFPLGLLLAVWVTRGIVRPLQVAVEAADRVAMGDTEIVLEAVGHDETGRLLHAIHKLVANFKSIVVQANIIASGDYTTEIKPRSDKDALGRALYQMTEALRTASDRNIREQWLKTGQAEISDVIRGEQDMATLASNALRYLAGYLQVHVGAAYVGSGDGALLRVATYALAQDRAAPARMAPGEGWVGQTALDKKPMLLAGVPSDSLLGSGLGGQPMHLLVYPLLLDDEVKGVIGLGSFLPFQKVHLDLMLLVAEPLAIAIHTACSRVQLEQLLTETRQQAQMLRRSEEELQDKTRDLAHQNAELERARHDIELKAQELEQASRYKSEFLANMSHELRTPLNSLLILSKDLAGNSTGNLTGQQIESATIIHQGGHDLLNLINDILDLSKVEAGQLQVDLRELDIHALLRGLRRQFDPIAQSKGVEFRVHRGAGVPERFTSDPQRVEQILRNLLGNAFKFTDKGSVTLSVERDPRAGAWLRWSVTDTGIGIPLDRQRAIWEAFQQADGSTSRSYGGTGLGLTISRNLAALLEGEVHLERSEPGRGSTFTLSLPVDVAPLALPTPVPAPRVEVQSDCVILIVEDDPTFAAMLAERSQSNGYRPVIASSGAKALSLAETLRPAAIILDVRLPDLDGQKVLERLKANPSTRHIPVHVISAAQRDPSFLHRGAIGYLTKPVDDRALGEVFSRFEKVLRARIKRVLVAGSVASTREIEQLLEGDAMYVDCIHHGAQVLERLSSGEVDCAVLDLDLDDMTSLELLQEATSRKLELPPVLLYTRRELTPQEHRQLAAYAATLVVKGLETPERLLDETSLFLHRPQKEARSLQGKRVLLVDDDLRNTFALSGLMGRAGIEVVMADNGQMALERMDEQGPFDLVLMDVMMPVMDGLEATRRIRQQGQTEIPILALTARAMPEDRVRCLEAGASDFLTKPIDPDRLMALLGVWLSEETRPRLDVP
jgi:CheY-like chemotaxis protein